MASEMSFDIVSKVDMQEAKNAVEQTNKEILTRFDLKDTKSEVKWDKSDLILEAKDAHKLKSVNEILDSKCLRRGISLKNLDKEKVEEALGGTARQRVRFKQGLSSEIAKEVVKEIKSSKLKVQPQVQGEMVRVSGKSRDDLQEVIQILKNKDFGIDLQFTNYR